VSNQPLPNENQSRLKEWLLYPLVASVATLVLHFVTGLAWGICAFTSFVGWPLLGTFVTADDDLPGGWSNPDGTERPPWRRARNWGQLSVGFAVAAFVAAVDAGVQTAMGAVFAITGLSAGIVAVVLLRRPEQ